MTRLSAISLIWMAGTLSAFSQTRQVVVLYDERIDFPGLAMLNAGFTRELTSGSPEQVEIYREEMDLSRFDSQDYRDRLRDEFRARYAGRKIDVVVAVMAPALDFLLSHRDEIFPGTPIVFSGLDRNQLGDRSLPADVTGVLVKREFAPTVELAARLQPDLERIEVVAGTSEFDTRLLAQAREEFRPFEKRFAFTYLTNLSLPELLSHLSQLPPKTVVLYTTLFRDGAGRSYVPHEVAERISAAANAPVYGFVDQYVGRGLVGGWVYGFGRHGEEAAGLVLQILSGRKAEELSPIEPANMVTMFDGRQLQRWKINKQRLPAGSTVLFRQPTTWQQYKGWIGGGVSLLVLQAALISVLVANLVRRKRAERSLGEIEARVALAADAAHLGVWELDTRTNKLWVSDKVRQLLAFEPGVEITYADFQGRVHPEDRVAREAAIQRAIETKGTYDIEFRVVLPNGTVRWLVGRARCIPDANGSACRLLGVSMDVTNRKEAEDLFRLATEASPSGILLLDEGGRILLANAHIEELFGHGRDELKGKTIGRLLPERFAERYTTARSAIIAGPEQADGEQELFARRKDGTEFPAAVGLNPIHDSHGLRVLVTIADLSARKAGEEEARQRREQVDLLSRVSLLGEMTASLAHELNQPLSAIVNNASAGIQYIDRDKLDPEELRDLLNDVVADGRRAYDIMRNVRSAIKKGSAIRGRINLNDVVKSVTHMVHPDAAVHLCKLETALAPDLPVIEGDPTQLQQVLINLVRNAFDAMRETPPTERRVQISTARNGHQTVEVAVRDFGSGISPGTRTQLFEQFFTTKEEGLGMGLAIVRSIIEAHGGKIAAENVYGGARFYFHLPIASPPTE